MIVADTGAVLALLDAHDRHHGTLSQIYNRRPEAWVLPWAILPEVDYLTARELGDEARDSFIADLVDGGFSVEWGGDSDLRAAQSILRRYRSLKMGLVDAVVIAVAERLQAEAIATLDVRHFGAVTIGGNPRLLPRDL